MKKLSAAREPVEPVRELFREIAGLAAPPTELTISQWADCYRYVPYPPEPGRWHTDRVPYLREPMDSITDPDLDTVVIMAGAQIGKTELEINTLGYFVHQEPCPVLKIDPTLDMAEVFSKTRLAPTIDETPVLAERIPKARARDSGNTLLHKTFPGGYLKMAGANSPASLASMPIRVVLGDEIDRWAASAGAEGDPMDLAWQRTTNFWNRRGVWVSTPTKKGESRIEAAFLATDQRRYFLPCHYCDGLQFLKWAQVRWDRQTEDAKTAYYQCELCGLAMSTAHIRMQLPAGQWQPTAKPAPGSEKARGYHIWAAYSPWVSLEEIVAKYLKAKDNPQRLKVWTNTVLAETFEEAGQRIDQVGLQKRAKESATPYEQLQVPARALLLTAGVDVQDDRLAVVIRAWGTGQETWLVLWEELHGDTSRPETWDQLGALLTTKYRTRDGRELGIACAGIDTGGHRTQEAYHFCRRYPRIAMAVKGANKRGEPIIAARPSKRDVSYRGEVIKAGVRLWMVGTDTAKDWIHSRLKEAVPGPRYWHFPIDASEDYYRQLTAEKKETRFANGFPLRVWVKKEGDRNEALDCEVYSLAAAFRLGIDRSLLKRLEKKLQGRHMKDQPEVTPPDEPIEEAEGLEEPELPPPPQQPQPKPPPPPPAPKKADQKVRPPRRRGWMGGL